MKAKFLVRCCSSASPASAFGLTLNPREVPSPLIDKPAPNFRLARLDQPEQTFALEEMRGQVWLLNVASWSAARSTRCWPHGRTEAGAGGRPPTRRCAATVRSAPAAWRSRPRPRWRSALHGAGSPITATPPVLGARHRRSRRHRLRRVWRARDLPDRPRRPHPLQAYRPDHPESLQTQIMPKVEGCAVPADPKLVPSGLHGLRRVLGVRRASPR